MNSTSENNSQNNTQRNSSLDQLMQANEEALTELELIPYETVIYALPKERRDAEMRLLKQAVQFQPTLNEMLSKTATADQLTEQRKLITEQLTDNHRKLSTKLQGYRDQVTQETADRKKAMQDHNKALTERLDTMSRDGKEKGQNILDAVKEMQEFIDSVKEMCSALRQKILLIAGIAAAALLVLQPLAFVLWLKLLT